MLLKKMHKKYFNFMGTRRSPMTPYLHLCTFKTPTCLRFMSAKVGSLCAFKMRKGVKGMNKRSQQKHVSEPYFKGRVKEKL